MVFNEKFSHENYPSIKEFNKIKASVDGVTYPKHG
jgi:hypothetical protein